MYNRSLFIHQTHIMNIVSLCKHLKISPLIRKAGTEQTESNEPIQAILADNYEYAINALPGGAGSEAQGNINTAFFEAKKALKGHSDLLHLIKTPQELAGVLELIPLNEIQPVLVALLNKEPTEKNIVQEVFKTSFADQAMAALMMVSSGSLAILTRGYLAYRFVQNTITYVQSERPTTELDNLINDGNALKTVLQDLPEIKRCDALIVIRHIKNYSELVQEVSTTDNSMSANLFNLNSSVNQVLDRLKVRLSGTHFNQVKGLLAHETKNYQLRNALHESNLVNMTEQALLEHFSEHQEKTNHIIMLFVLLELINVFNQYSLSTAPDSWKIQVDAYKTILKLSALVRQNYQKIADDLSSKDQDELKNIVKTGLSEKFYSFLCNAWVDSADFDMSNLFTQGRYTYYMGQEGFVDIEKDLNDRIESCASTIERFLDSQTDQGKILDEHSPSKQEELNTLLLSTILVSKQDEVDEESSVADSDLDSFKSAQEEEGEEVDGQCADSFVLLETPAAPITKLTPEQLKQLSKDLQKCIEENCQRIIKKPTAINAQEVSLKKTTYWARCFVVLDGLDFEEQLEKNRLILSSICVLIFLISTAETNKVSSVTQAASNRIDTFFATQVEGSRSSKAIVSILKPYDLTISPALICRRQDELLKIIRCFENGMWPVAISALFRFDAYLEESLNPNSLTVSAQNYVYSKLSECLSNLSHYVNQNLFSPEYYASLAAGISQYLSEDSSEESPANERPSIQNSIL